MPRPLFSLSPRLALCAQLVRPGSRLADVGTDHAYLPIWLLRRGIVPEAVCCDVNPGPLKSAERHAKQYQVADRLRLILSDGLTELCPEDAQDIVIAGMGGDLILRIIQEAPWLKDPSKLLILQPMSSADALRAGLWTMGFPITIERAVEDRGKIYSAFCTQYVGSLPPIDPLYTTMGRLTPGESASVLYAIKTVRWLSDQLRGAEHHGKECRELRSLIDRITQRYLTESGDNNGKNL